MNGKTLFGLLVMALLLAVLVPAALADSNESFAAAQALIAQQVPCDNLSQEQLEGIGDYYMEQMHPGVAHEAMDAMMGGEGSESLKQMHIAMAERFYCGDYGSANARGYGMMGGGMMDGDGAYGCGMMGGGMMSGYPTRSWNDGRSAWSLVNTTLLTVLLLALIVLTVFGIVCVSRRENGHGKR